MVESLFKERYLAYILLLSKLTKGGISLLPTYISHSCIPSNKYILKANNLNTKKGGDMLEIK